MNYRTIDKALRAVRTDPGATIESGYEHGAWWLAIHLGRPCVRGWGSGQTLAAAARVALWRLYASSIGGEPAGPELTPAESAELIWWLTPGPRA